MNEVENKQEESIPFYPDHFLTELKVTIGLLVLVVLIGIMGLINPVGVGDQADPMNTPTHVKPEWYFLALYQLLKFIPKTAGVVIPIIGVIILIIWPFFDRKKEETRRPQRIRLIVSIIGIIIFIAMTIWGEVS